jgi:eukaryotic-like serine/threonine-protein kinase
VVAAGEAAVRFSPDGKRLAFSMTAQGHQDIWVQDLDHGTASRLTALTGVNDTPVWTADGLNLIFRSLDQPNPGLYGVRADGSGQAQRLLDLRSGEFPSSVSPDGKRLAIADLRAGGTIRMAPVDSDRNHLALGKAEPFLQTPFNPVAPARSAPAFSPDGRWLAYCSNESGQLEVYVVPFPGPGEKRRISSGSGEFPIWSRHGRELFFLDLDSNKIMVTTYKETGDSFAAAKPQMWSDKRLLELGTLQSYDVAPDGKRFAAVLYADGTADRNPVTSLTFLLNFFDELRRRVPKQ